jgi:tRNA-5-taurinomethyluridine 2-sulfurtransferase
MNSKTKIAILLSGGVDSSVSLALLQQQGFAVTAFYLKIWLEDELSFLGTCPWQEDLEYVKAVCNQLNVPLEIISLQKEYQAKIVSYVISETRAGRTPNPDILCNKHIKFGVFFDAIGNKFDKIASGHYAQIIEKNGIFALKTAPDAIKDQTYFLSQLSQAQLSRLVFPIGHLNKKQVRDYAEQFDLPNKNRPDSQGICFLGKLKFREFLACHLGKQTGNIIEIETGKQLGNHEGYWFYTIGQRQGLGLSGGPWFVVSKDQEKNVVFVSRSYYAADKKRNSFIVSNVNWMLKPNLSKKNTELFVKLRHGAAKYQCTLDAVEHNCYKVTLSENDQGIATGQFAVFYQDVICLGGGVMHA